MRSRDAHVPKPCVFDRPSPLTCSSCPWWHRQESHPVPHRPAKSATNSQRLVTLHERDWSPTELHRITDGWAAAMILLLAARAELGPADALEVVTTFAQERIVPASADLVLRGLALSHASQISAWDALIVQSALDAGCTTLYSEDFQNGMRFDDLVVVNPFVLQAHEPVPKATHEVAHKVAHKRR